MRQKRDTINMVFDLDDTMYDLMEPFQKAHEALFASRVKGSSTELFLKSRIYSDVILEREKEGKIRKEDTFHERLCMTYGDAGIELTREESDRFEAAYRHNQTVIEMFDFMKEVLDYCKEQQIPIGVLTNGRSEGQRRKGDVLNLQKWFSYDRIFVSGEIGYQKPDVRAFQVVEERMGALPEHIWYVGDTYESDMTGAAQAGWHTVWLNHRKRKCPVEISVAEVELTSGKELLPLVKRLHEGR